MVTTEEYVPKELTNVLVFCDPKNPMHGELTKLEQYCLVNGIVSDKKLKDAKSYGGMSPDNPICKGVEYKYLYEQYRKFEASTK